MLDTAEFYDEGPSNEELKRISDLALKQLRIEADIVNLVTAMERKKKELEQVRDKDLPAAMQEAGCTSYTLANGRKIEVKTEIYCSIPEDKREQTFAWLRNHEFGAIIKNVISAEFGKGEDKEAVKAATLLAEAGFRPVQKESIHPSTLKAFVKEQVTKGAEIPLDLFGAFIIDRAKVS